MGKGPVKSQSGVSKGKRALKNKVIKAPRLKKVGSGSLKSALMAQVKASSSRKDIQVVGKATKGPQFAFNAMLSTPPEDRAGYPVRRAKGSADPKTWTTNGGARVNVDFRRASWVPDDYAQGVKACKPIARSRRGAGGTYTVWLEPGGRTFYHQWQVEDFLGRKLGPQDGFRGQLRAAWLQGKAIALPTDSDASFFKLLNAAEKKCLPSKNDLHYCIVSARRAGSVAGMRSIAAVQAAFSIAGVEPTWYVDKESLNDYRALGLKAVIGGPLTAARNKALEDAFAQNKACVQCSDDISSWEYRDGPKAANRDFKLLNAAYEAATRYVISPVSAARFMLAKMRGVTDGEQPRLGGTYMLSSCSGTFADDPICRNGFILGDFFVVDKTKVRFDRNMKLKEDYDFTCSHLNAHGSIMRFNRMTVSAKHYTNTGGAVSVRKDAEEKRNIRILFKKWPGAFIKNKKRKNEVLLKWGSKRHQESRSSSRARKVAKA